MRLAERTTAQRGQSMVEFAIVLPILLILSFGTLEMGLYLQRRLSLGGASFVAARSAAVQGPAAQTDARQVVQAYAQDARAPWISQAANTCKVDSGQGPLVRVSVTEQGDAWSGLLTGSVAAEGGRLKRIGQWSASAPMSQEYVGGGTGSSGDVARTQTDQMIDYEIQVPWVAKIPNFAGLTSLAGFAGLGSSAFLKAINPTVQAVAPNPHDRRMNGAMSPSKTYVSCQYEDQNTTNAALLETGLGPAGLAGAVGAFEAAYVAPGNPAAQAMTAFVDVFATLDRSVGFDQQAANVQQAEKAVFAF